MTHDLDRKMGQVRQICASLLAMRAEAGIKIRQPLRSAELGCTRQDTLLDRAGGYRDALELIRLICEEINLRHIRMQLGAVPGKRKIYIASDGHKSWYEYENYHKHKSGSHNAKKLILVALFNNALAWSQS